MQPERPVQIAMVGSLASRADNLDPDLIIFDEAHHIAAPSWKVITHRWPEAKRLGLTATPQRLDRKPLTPMFTNIINGPSHQELREPAPGYPDGYLAQWRYFAPTKQEFQTKLAEIREDKKTGDYATTELSKFMSGRIVLGDTVSHFRGLGGNRSALAFCITIEASKALIARFNEAGVPARHVDGSTSPSDRAAAIHALKDKTINVLSSVWVFAEGLDLPMVDTIILMRPTHSVAFYLQMIGRAMRPSGNLVQILDHAALVYEHGLPDIERMWKMDGASPDRKPGSGTLRRCPECTCVHERSGICPHCGHVYERFDRSVEEADGTLIIIKETSYAARQPEPEAPAPIGLMTIGQYAEHCGVEPATVLRWIREGMPWIGEPLDVH